VDETMTALSDRERWITASPPPRFEDVAGRQVGGPFSQTDLLGRKVPRRLGLPDYLLWIARIDPARVRKVPARAIVDDGRDEDGEFTLVACPCGHQPVVRPALERCPGCERHFVHVEQGAVWVTYANMTPPPLTARVAQEVRQAPGPLVDARAVPGSGAGCP
jgi:hypothetical protein